MDCVKFILSSSGTYHSKRATNIEMDILGIFLSSDVGSRPSSFRDWFFDETTSHANSNATVLDKENGYVLLSDLYSEEDEPTELKMTYAQFLKLLDDWESKVLKSSPAEVIIKHVNNEFIFETSNDS